MRRQNSTPTSVFRLLAGVAIILAGVAGLVSCKPVGDATWDNPVDQNGSNYHLPTVVLHDTDIRDPNGVIVPLGASLNSVIREYRWQRDGQYIGTTSGPLSVTGWPNGLHSVSVRATDGNGLTSNLSMASVWIGNRLPILAAIRDTVVSANAMLSFNLLGRDTNGAIAYYAWDTANVGYRYVSVTGEIKLAAASGGSRSVRWKAVDNDSGVSFDVFTVQFVPAPSIKGMKVDSSLIDWSGSIGTQFFTWDGGVPNFPDEQVYWTLSVGSGVNLSPVYNGLSNHWDRVVTSLGQHVNYRLVGKNRFGDSSTLDGGVNAMYSLPAPEFSLPSGPYYSVPDSVYIVDSNVNARIFYTTNGTDPTLASTLYNGPVSISSPTITLKAIAAIDGVSPSKVSVATYTSQVGSLLDARDGHVYKTVKIGAQIWMGQNLNYAGSVPDESGCYRSSADSCGKYGRLYTWIEVMGGNPSSTSNPSGVNGICPVGWHIPADAEWEVLFKAIGGDSTGGKLLKSKNGWSDGFNGIDKFGFCALPAGRWDRWSYWFNIGIQSGWWTSSEKDYADAWVYSVNQNNDLVGRQTFYVGAAWDKRYDRFSMRCVKD